MPYRRNYRKRNYRRKARGTGPATWASRARTVASTAMAAYRGYRYIRGLVNSEMLSTEATATGTLNLGTSATVVHLTAVGQGDTESTRTGNGIYVRSLLWRLGLVCHASAASTFVRCIILRDTQQVSDTAPALSEVVQTTANIWSPLWEGTKGRFDILCDKIFTLSNISQMNRNFQTYKKMRSHVRFNGGNSTDVQKNHLYAFLYSDQATDTPSFTYYYRVGYHDN